MSDRTRRCARCEERSMPITMHSARGIVRARCPLCGYVDEIPQGMVR